VATDIERIRNDVSLPDIAGRFGLKLTKNGDEFEACCPFHAEKTPSFTLFTGKDKVDRFHCFGCGEKGDAIDFVEKIKGVGKREAIAILGGGASGPNVAPKVVEIRDIYAGIVPLDPVGVIEAGKRVTLYNPKRAGSSRETGSFAPSMVFPYRTIEGGLIGYVLRHDLPDGGKETPMVMWVRLSSGRECWARYPFPRPRPLYGLETLGDAKQVIVVEGEKVADALRSACGRTVLSWVGGTQGVKHCDWSPLAGRNVVMWPDADAPGRSAMDEIGKILSGFEGTTFRRIETTGRAA
jgi:hypothetical protein